MAKNRRRREAPEYPAEYKTHYGKTIPTDGHSPEWMSTMEDHMHLWITGDVEDKSPDSVFTKEELEYIEAHMESSLHNKSVPTGHLTRCERGHHLLDENGNLKIKVGDTLSSKGKYRSYSRTPTATIDYLKHKRNTVIIYRTNGDVKHFNATNVDGWYDFERESFVEQGKLRVTGIKQINKDDFDLKGTKFDKAVKGYNVKYNKAVSDELGTKAVRDLRSNGVIIIDVEPVD